MNFRNDLSADYVRSMLDYDPETGTFIWKVGFGRKRRIGQVAGKVKKQGYVVIYLKRAGYIASRLAWVIMTGHWPAVLVDHEDRDRANNIWANLREATHGQNRTNCKPYSRNKCGLKGARKNGNRWQALISVNRKFKHLGSFATAEEAHERYLEEAKKLWGEFARGAA